MICNVVGCKSPAVMGCSCGHQVCQIHSAPTVGKKISGTVCVECVKVAVVTQRTPGNHTHRNA